MEAQENKKNQNMTINNIIKLVEKYPNDIQLGKRIRHLYYENKEKEKNSNQLKFDF